jgi:hypothetical protein
MTFARHPAVYWFVLVMTALGLLSLIFIFAPRA